ncbi:MAG: TetR/AcrR family transcriptional regulator C-terminal domain-containing protein [Spirochaetales bacterium]|nr:TetR/AcrR family transcriptional regulator C-terminal domain-containing protein [Spirochaetales bacterium]
MTGSVTAEMTRDLLARSLMALMQTRALDQVTVKDVVALCGLNRRTFYYHFRDMYDLLGWLYKKEAINPLVACARDETWNAAFINFLKWLRANKEFANCACRSLDREYIECYHQTMLTVLIRKEIDELNESKGVAEHRKDFLANLYSITFTSLTLQWLRNGMEEDPERLVDALEGTLSGSMKLALRRCASADRKSART